jgi:hypothetical protein
MVRKMRIFLAKEIGLQRSGRRGAYPTRKHFKGSGIKEF